MTSRQLRLLRGAAVSCIATVTAAVSHTVGGGAPPHPLLVIALCVFLAPIATLLVGRTLHIGRLSASVLLSQTVFHLIFAALGATLMPGGSPGGHQHGLILPGAGTALATGTPGTIIPGTAMLAAHLVAGVLTIAMLWRGERLLRAIARWVRAALRTRTPRPLTDFPLPPALGTTARRFASTIRAGDLSLRGPPFLLRG